MNPFDEEDIRLLGIPLTGKVLRCAMAVHQELGPGLLASAYRTAMLRELRLSGLGALSEVTVGMNYKGVAIDCGYRALAKLRVGLIINFNSIHLRHALKRVVI